MRVFVTGGSGFVGHWLTSELERSGHTVVGARAHADVTDREAVGASLVDAAPHAVVHLAAVSYAPDASAHPETAFEVNVRGTLNVVETVRIHFPGTPLLVAGSSEVYAEPDRSHPVLIEDSPIGPRNVYGLSKLAAEGLALAAASQHGLRVAVTRAFNHIGPGQRDVFVVPAIARRIHEVTTGTAVDVRVGNVDVRRDFSDVRDVVVAYRLIIEGLASGVLPAGGLVFNVASGRPVAIREIVELLTDLAGVNPRLTIDPELVRQGEPAEIAGDASRLRAATGWRPMIGLRETLEDVWRDVHAQA